MALPFMLYMFATYIDGVGYVGETEEVKLPKLGRVMESFRAGGMSGAVKIDLGNDEMEAEIKFGGLVKRALESYGAPTVDGVQMRWVGSYKSGSSAVAQAVEVTMRGRFQEVDFGTQKAGEKSEQGSKFPISYYKLEIDGSTMIEIDMMSGVTIVNGVDIDAQHRANIGT